MSQFSSLVQEYYKNPINNYCMKDATISQHEGNAICGDDITIYLQLQIPEGARQGAKSVVTARSYDGNVSMITQAAASFFSELIIGHTMEEILQRDESLMIENGFEVSYRRRRARVIALLATRNALHSLMQDGQNDTFDDVLGE